MAKKEPAKKELKGVIRDWFLMDNRIRGICVLHTTHENGIEAEQPITTSTVVRIVMRHGIREVETKNSRYILLD